MFVSPKVLCRPLLDVINHNVGNGENSKEYLRRRREFPADEQRCMQQGPFFPGAMFANGTVLVEMRR